MVKHTGNRKIDKKTESLKDVLEILMDSSSFKYESCALKLMQLKLNSGQEKEICYVFLELCCENDIYTENLGHMTQVRFRLPLYRLFYLGTLCLSMPTY